MLTRRNAQSIVSKNRLLLCVAALSAVSAFGCADEGADGADVDGEVQSAPDDLALQATGGTQTVPNPNGAYFAKVTANGTGCPTGTWDAEISDDGKTFRLRFSRYVAMVDEKISLDVKDCAVAIKLHSPSGLSYAVSNFYYSGYVFLDQGVKARQIARYYFQGFPVANEQVRADMIGPMDDDFLFEDKVTTADAVVWSPCGVDRDLNIDTTLRLQNSSPRRTGYINVAHLNANTESQIVFNLSWRKCDAPGAAPTTPTGTTGSGSTGSSNSGTSRGRRR